MAPRITAEIEPSVLAWARRTIDLDAAEAAEKIGVPEERIEAWESGEGAPSIAQLRKAATVYRRPFAAFFLPEPPTIGETMRDFRHRGAAAAAWSPDLHAEHRRALHQRACWLELDALDGTAPGERQWSPERADDDVEELAADARARLLDGSPIALPRRTGTPYEHLNAWVAAIEETGVLVLNTRRGAVSLDEMRVFSIAFERCPVIVVNGKDGPRGRLFALVHAFAHLLLGEGGLCDATTDHPPTSPERRLEARCNALAEAVLMPADEVLARDAVRARRDDPSAWDHESLRDEGALFGVGAERFFSRLSALDVVPTELYLEARDAVLDDERADGPRSRSSGGNWYRTTARDLGKGYVRRVADAHQRRVIDSYTAAAFLGVKAGQISRLGEQVPARP